MAETFTLRVANTEFYLDLIFANITRESIELNTEITDHLVEDNSYVQDHIAVKPIVYTMSGLIGEKVDKMKDDLTFMLPPETLTAKLNPLKSFIPTMTSYVQSAINVVITVRDKVVSVYKTLLNTINNLKTLFVKNPLTLTVDTRHEKWNRDKLQAGIYNILKDIRDNRIPVQVNTGWGFELNDYYILNVSLSQGDTYQQSELSVTLKELKFTTTQTRKFSNEDYQRYANQMAQEKELGKLQGIETPLESELHKIGVERGFLKQ